MNTEINSLLNFDHLPVLAKNKNLASIQLNNIRKLKIYFDKSFIKFNGSKYK
ncbi:hypothetical protein [Borreliella valaisiana]|uniref:hypothetical protein n=1 Tax=Borreliella valaisiana TaxID=62088 RepID=UPI002ED0B7BD